MSFARLPCVAALVVALLGSLSAPALAEPIQWVTVGDPGNLADTAPAGYGAVADSFRIMKYEFTNQQYTDFLNSVAATDTYSLYNALMGSETRGGITRSGSSGGFAYTVKTNMGDKPVNYVSWFDVARVSNWLINGATGTSSTETGGYTLVGGQTSGIAPAVNNDATFWLPTENQWYKAAYYKASGTNAGYWDFAMQSNAAPTPKSGCRARTLHLLHGPRRSGLRRLLALPPSPCSLTRALRGTRDLTLDRAGPGRAEPRAGRADGGPHRARGVRRRSAVRDLGLDELSGVPRRAAGHAGHGGRVEPVDLPPPGAVTKDTNARRISRPHLAMCADPDRNEFMLTRKRG
jgi:hypothetical protein